MKKMGFLVAGAALVLAGCGGGDEKSGASDESPTQATPTAAASEVTWKYLQETYAGSLTTCEDSSIVVSCIGLRTSNVKSLARDAAELPASRDRGNLLNMTDSYLEDADQYSASMCSAGADLASMCGIHLVTMNIGVDTMKTIIDRGVSAE